MGSTARTENHRAIVLSRLAVAWDKRPGLTLGQLLDRGLATVLRELDAIDDESLVEAVDRFVLLDLDADPDTTRRP